MRQLTLYLEMPNLTFLFTATSNNTPQLFNGNGKVNREVLEKKREEIYGQRCLLPAGQAISKILSLEDVSMKMRSEN